MSSGPELLNGILVQNDPVNFIDPEGLHGTVLLGRAPYINRPSVLRGGRVPRPGLNRNPTPKPNPKPKPNEPLPLEHNHPPVEFPKTFWGELMDKFGALMDGWGGACGPPVIIDQSHVDSQT